MRRSTGSAEIPVPAGRRARKAGSKGLTSWTEIPRFNRLSPITFSKLRLTSVPSSEIEMLFEPRPNSGATARLRAGAAAAGRAAEQDDGQTTEDPFHLIHLRPAC